MHTAVLPGPQQVVPALPATTASSRAPTRPRQCAARTASRTPTSAWRPARAWRWSAAGCAQATSWSSRAWHKVRLAGSRPEGEAAAILTEWLQAYAGCACSPCMHRRRIIDSCCVWLVISSLSLQRSPSTNHHDGEHCMTNSACIFPLSQAPRLTS
jgi:hypothetical protein